MLMETLNVLKRDHLEQLRLIEEIATSFLSTTTFKNDHPINAYPSIKTIFIPNISRVSILQERPIILLFLIFPSRIICHFPYFL